VNSFEYYGGIVVSFALVTYALERGRRFTVPVALACALASGYGFAKGSWSFGVIEALWCVIALRRAAKFR
jgi:hypothetical protein